MAPKDDAFYERAIEEIRTKNVIKALWGQALSEADGDKERTVARYIALRVARFKEAEKLRPWVIRRVVARTIDIIVESVIALALFALALSHVEGLRETFVEANEVVLGLGMTALIMMLDGICMMMFRNTPGKRLLGITVVRMDGSRPSDDDFMRRTVYVWAQAFAFGVPLFSQVAGLVQLWLCLSSGSTSYDKKLGLRLAVSCRSAETEGR